MKVFAIAILPFALGACSFMDLFSEPPTPACADDSDCATVRTGDPCVVAVCDQALGRCVRAAQDIDQDGHAPVACLGHAFDIPFDDCDDRDALTYGGAPELCNDYDDDCDGELDEDCGYISQVTGGERHTCALLPSGRPVCWGDSAYGQLGVVDKSPHTHPLPLLSLTDVVQIASGQFHNCVRHADGGVSCWGSNDWNELGVSTDTLPSVTPQRLELPPIVDIAASSSHTCAVSAQGNVYCWGTNALGESGFSATEAIIAEPRMVPGLTDCVDVELGEAHGCALTNSHQVYCWGDNSAGQLGNGRFNGRGPTLVRSLANVIQIAVGGYFGCALLDDGSIRCWGANDFGQLGNGVAEIGLAEPVPVVVSGISTAAEVAVGFVHTCSRLQSGSVMCWGEGTSGGLGAGLYENSAVPVHVWYLSDALALGTGDFHTCAVSRSEVLLCWGVNAQYQLGVRSPVTSPAPVRPEGF